MDLFFEYLKVVLDWILPLLKVVGVGVVAGIGAFGVTEMIPLGKPEKKPARARAVSTLLACGLAWLVNFSDLLEGFGHGPKSWALVIVAGVFGSFVAERVHDAPPPGLGWLKRKTVVGLLMVALAAPSYAGTAFEARAGDRDGATFFGLAFDAPFHVERSVSAGALLEFGEDDSVTLLARLAKAWPNRVTPYVGLGVGVAFQEVPVQSLAIPPDGRHGRSYTVTAGTEQDAGLALEAFAGLRGAIKPGLLWFVEASARDQQVNDGVGAAVGLRWRCGQ